MDELHAAIAAHLHRPRETVVYARVARSLPGDPGSLDAQIAACREYARAHGPGRFMIALEVAEDDHLERPQLAQLRAAIAHGRIGTVLVTTLDRLTGDPVLLGALRAEWGALGVAIVAIGETP